MSPITVSQSKQVVDEFNAMSSAAKSWLDASKSVNEAAKSAEDLLEITKTIASIAKFGSALSAVGAALGLINIFLPSPTEIILKELNKISDQITSLESEMKTKFKELKQQNLVNTANVELFENINTINATCDAFNNFKIELKKANGKTLAEIDSDTRFKIFSKYIDYAKQANILSQADLSAFSTNLKSKYNIIKAVYENSGGEINEVCNVIKSCQTSALLGMKLIVIRDKFQAHSALQENIDQPGFEKNILPKFLDNTKNTDDFLINSMQSYNNQTPQKDSVLEDIETYGNMYIKKCQDEWAANAVSFLDDNDTISFPADPKSAPKPILNSLDDKFPFIDWMVIVSSHPVPKDGGDIAVATFGIQEKSRLRKNFIPYEPFRKKYTNYFGDDETNLNLVVWGFLRDNDAPLKQITHDTFSVMRDDWYLNATDKDMSAKEQYNGMMNDTKMDGYTPDAFYIVHLEEDLAVKFGLQLATNNPQMYFATPYNWNGQSYDYQSKMPGITFTGRMGIDLQVAGHHGSRYGTNYWVDPFVLVCRIGQDGNKLG
ncbi:MAG: hypothetical protein DHS20C18_21620 [Saprospiraceae bacterium]|nr:MAG: hypothetical protein DHS20C18_21620 [Saprospiraceae bacterium]